LGVQMAAHTIIYPLGGESGSVTLRKRAFPAGVNGLVAASLGQVWPC
jgi:hypothetical protein